ncbi:hypothetical protein HY989_05955 [Candidatus Micrarchaeota archaeon]|nr:hypothetical protein [Candidatus Micrarchaeota archaeon]
MDAKAIVREMLNAGHTKSEIVSNLQELGIFDAEKYYEDALRETGKGSVSSDLNVGSISSDKGKSLFDKDSDTDEEAKDILDQHTTSIFQDSRPKKAVTTESAMEDIPQLEITSINDEGEKVKNIGEMLGKNSSAKNQLVRNMPTSSLQHLDEVESKLDEMISLLKAVYEIDRKILDANRDVLLRLKTDK